MYHFHNQRSRHIFFTIIHTNLKKQSHATAASSVVHAMHYALDHNAITTKYIYYRKHHNIGNFNGTLVSISYVLTLHLLRDVVFHSA